jgi:hypothetical protein
MRVRVTIANHLMDQGKFAEARTYAEAAAATWAGDGMACAARCYEGLQDWDNAELWIRRLGERYSPAYNMEWYLWCKSVGHGDVDAARRAAAEWVQAAGLRGSGQERNACGVFFILEKEPRKALDVFRALFEKSRGAFHGLYVAMLADELGDARLRDDTLDSLINGPKSNKTTVAFARLLRDWLAGGKEARFDRAAFDAVIDKYERSAQSMTQVLLARMLLGRGQAEVATGYLLQAARTKVPMLWFRAMAVSLLRERGIDLGKGKATASRPLAAPGRRAA